jgi:hypothetical protein
MKRVIVVVIGLAVLVGASRLGASGPLGVFAIVEKVAFEPNDTAPERVRVWGAFAFTDGDPQNARAVSAAKHGYIYFTLPTDAPSTIPTIRREWADLKSVAGTGQAIGFGNWFYMSTFNALQPDVKPQAPSAIYQTSPAGGGPTDLRVRPDAEPPASPAIYRTNAGIVKISADGNRADVVKALRATLGR